MTAAATGGRGVESLGRRASDPHASPFLPPNARSPEGAVVALDDRRERRRLERVATSLHGVQEDEQAPLWAAFTAVAQDVAVHPTLRAMARAGADALDGIVERGHTVEDTMALLDRSMRAELERLAARAGQG